MNPDNAAAIVATVLRADAGTAYAVLPTCGCGWSWQA